MPEEDDLGWDEIEDLSSIDEKKATHGGSPNRADVRKRLSATEEEEDLSWDIEDDDGNRRPEKVMRYIATEGTGLTISNFYYPDYNYISNPDNNVEIELRLIREYIYDE